jgi:hypothetical protein
MQEIKLGKSMIFFPPSYLLFPTSLQAVQEIEGLLKRSSLVSDQETASSSLFMKF